MNVHNSNELTAALNGALPGTTIQLADGTYTGQFLLKRSGTPTAPITISGSRAAVLTYGLTTDGYVLHLDNANYARLSGFTITGGKKSLVLDQTSHATITSLDTGNCGEESILVRNYSSSNIISNNTVHNSGLQTPGYGEGIYIGLAYSNWSSDQSRTGGQPDPSNGNQILSNTIYDTGAENIDIKEGTSGGVISGNTLNGAHMSGQNDADSFIDIAGNGYLIVGNVGTNALLDGIQTHTQGPGQSAANNVFRSNSLHVNAAGYGIRIDTKAAGNVVYTSNVATGAALGLANIPLTNG